jgi:hypothetical protein
VLLFASLLGLTACPGSSSTPPDSTTGTIKTDPAPPEGESNESGFAVAPTDSGEIPGPTLPAGDACESDADCDAEQVCEGVGCGAREGRCAARDRMCTRDLATYCGCDGKEFQSSGSCPGGRFVHRGACSSALGLGESCTNGQQCASGLCSGEGLEGCSTRAAGQCSEAGCTKDLATYCGCNGFEFQGSGSCPNQQFAYRGPCENESAAPGREG